MQLQYVGVTLFFLVIAIFSPYRVVAERDMEQGVVEEISLLLSYLEKSECEFNRNGTWYTGKRAVAHIRKKYTYLLKRGLIDSTDSFIELAASKSSMSGKAYRVRCADEAPVDSSTWFHEALDQLKKK